MLTKTDAIVLKSMKYSDTSKIVTFYTRQFGKLKGIAKGARSNKSKFGASLETGMHVSLMVYKKEQRELHLISQADILTPFKRIHNELERMSAALGVIELVDRVTHGEEEHAALFALVLNTLRTIEGAPRNFITPVYAFQLRLASAFGFAPSLDQCMHCGRDLEKILTQPSVPFLVARGGVLCDDCSGTGSGKIKGKQAQTPGTTRISLPVLKIFRRLLAAKFESLTSIEYDEHTRNEIDETLRLYLRYHFEDLKPLRSTRIFEQLLT
ncbi:MAG: DNA repair protein RecO [Bacteroidota bacterium]